MAPEQLEGQEADSRTDIFAFGALVYEMLTGRKAFEGKSQASLIAAILEREPPATSTIQPLISPAIDRIVKKCLAKNPDHRWQTAQDLFDELSWVVASGSQPGIPIAMVGSRGRLTNTLLAVTSCLLAVAVTALAFVATRHAQTTNQIRFLVTTPDLPAAPDNSLAVSPDGRSIAFVASTPTKTLHCLCVRWARRHLSSLLAQKGRAIRSGRQTAALSRFRRRWIKEGGHDGWTTPNDLRNAGTQSRGDLEP